MSLLQERLDKLNELNAAHGLLSDWERGFLESIMQQHVRNSRLSHRQLEILDRMEKKASPDGIREIEEWFTSWDDDKREIFDIAVNYYRGSGYFSTVLTAVDMDPNYVPSKKVFTKICNNKYIKKVVVATQEPARYAVGSTVMLRASAASGVWKFTTFKNTPCLVIEAGGIVKSAAKGSKPYKILPYGSLTALELEERHIKPFRATKEKTINKNVDVDVDIPF